jgi:nitrate reductase alpha subunit
MIISRAPTIPTCSTEARAGARDRLKDGSSLRGHGVRSAVRQLRPRPGLGGEHVARDYADRCALHPRLGEKITGVPAEQIITVAREFAANAEKTNGKSMVILGAGPQPLVPYGHELSRHHQSAGDVRLRRPVGRRLGALCGPGKAASADRLAPLAFALDWAARRGR